MQTLAAGPQIKPAIENGPDLSYLIYKNPAEVDNSELPVTPTDKLHLTGKAPTVNIDEYWLSVNGTVENPLVLTYEDILAYPPITEVVLLICPYTFADNAEWTGAPLSIILDEASIRPGASKVTFYAVDGFNITLPLETVRQEGVFLAYEVNGQTLPPEHGYPMRLVVKGNFGSFWVKWLDRIEVS
jgi:DMSO/TMAO reductase YedYZ molybdopterin-dependent catalytic subunit